MLILLLLQNMPQQIPTEAVHQNDMKRNFGKQKPNFALIQDEENLQLGTLGT